MVHGAVVLATVLVGCSARAPLVARVSSNDQATAETYGWKAELERGHEIVKSLSALGVKLKNLEFTGYRDERVAFIGGGTPGGMNDLLIEGGFYLRVVNPRGKDLRPEAVWWNAIVCGSIIQVFPENKIIVIRVDEKNWKTLDTG